MFIIARWKLNMIMLTSDVTLLPDFFLDGETPESIKGMMDKQSTQNSSSGEHKQISTGNTDLDNTFNHIQSNMGPDLVKTINGVFQFDFKGNSNYCLIIDLFQIREEVGCYFWFTVNISLTNRCYITGIIWVLFFQIYTFQWLYRAST